MTEALRALELEGVGVRYRRRRQRAQLVGEEHWPLKDVSFSLSYGESLGIVGRNGTGKSTLLQVLAGIITPDRGSITQRCKSVSLLALNVGFMPELTGRDNLILSGRLLGIPRAEVLALAPAIIEFAEIESSIDEPVGTYSTGMAVRLGFSLAIYARSDVLLIDEVLGVGDLKFQQKSSLAIQRLIRSEQTVVLVSHATEPIQTLCTRALWIDEGRVKADGAPQAVLDVYKKEMIE